MHRLREDDVAALDVPAVLHPRAILSCATRIVDVFAHHDKFAPCGIFPQSQQLRLGVLAFVDRGDPGIDRHALLRYHSIPINKEVLCDALLCHEKDP